MKPNGRITEYVQRVCNDTLPWLISFSLDLSPRCAKEAITNRLADTVGRGCRRLCPIG